MEPQLAALQLAKPLLAEPQLVELQRAEPQRAEPQLAELQLAEPQLVEARRGLVPATGVPQEVLLLLQPALWEELPALLVLQAVDVALWQEVGGQRVQQL